MPAPDHYTCHFERVTLHPADRTEGARDVEDFQNFRLEVTRRQNLTISMDSSKSWQLAFW